MIQKESMRKKMIIFLRHYFVLPLGIHHHLVVSTFSVFLPNKYLYEINLKPQIIYSFTL